MENMIKRIIIGVIVGLILMLCSKYIVFAEEIGTIANVNIHNEFTSQVSRLNQSSDLTSTDVSIETPLPSNSVFANYGKGFVIFSFAYYSEKVSANTNYQSLISGVSVKSGNQLYACEIGNLEPYTDNTVQFKQATAKCYVNFGSNGWERIRFTTPYLPKGTRLNIILSRYGTFVGASTPTSNQDIVNAISTTSQQQIQLQTQTNAKLDTQIQQNQTIISQNEQQIQNQNDIKDSINNDNVDGANQHGSDFFNNMQNTDNGGISGLVSAPLRMINKATNTCTPLRFTIFEQEITLPCGDTLFWNRNDVSSFRVIWNCLFGGAFLYALMRKVFNTIQNMKDSENMKVEVMKL